MKSTVSRSVVKEMVQANYASLTPMKQSEPNMLSPKAKLNAISMSASRNPATKQHALTLEAAIDGEIKDTESYKKRSVSNFRNPLLPPKENLVSIPDFDKGQLIRKPFYVQNNDLIVNGIGENIRGMPRHSDKETLIGHQNIA